MRRLAMVALLSAATFMGFAGAEVCQVMTEADTPLQQTLGIYCDVMNTTCSCTSSVLPDVHWTLLTRDLNETLDGSARPGEWFLTDPTGRCVSSARNDTKLVALPCPPGFYCPGGLDPPLSCASGDFCPGSTLPWGRRCPETFFCPVPAGPKLKCLEGGWCPLGSSQPAPCEAGFYCKSGERTQCPRRSYCPFGSESAQPCRWFARCPAGSKYQDVRLVALLFSAIVAGIAVYGAKNYKFLVRHSFLAFVASILLVGVAWTVDAVIAGYLSIFCLSVAANWALLKVGSCPAIVAHLLMCCTFVLAIAAVWRVNPSWALLVQGMLFCTFLGWLMSRQSLVAVLIGRLLLVVAFVVLIVAYWHVDPQFVLWGGSFVLVLVFGLLISWVVEQRRQRRRVALPFLSRWGNDIGRLRMSSSSLSFTDRGGAAATEGSTLGIEALSTSFSSSSTVGLQGGGGGPTAGVSFRLKGVSFDLPDGKLLLRDVSFGIKPGKRVAVMGPSGGGKSTLLAVLSGRASYGKVSGELLVGGYPADDLRFLRHVTGFVPQDDILHGELTVEENVRFQAALRLPAGTTAAQVEAKVAEVAKELNVDRILQERVGTPERRGVSGGQRKRVSIAMELVTEPQLLFADEPTSGLDSTTSHEVVRCLNGAAARLGTTVIAVIHQPRYETLQLFDDLILLAVGGCLVYAGPTKAAVDHFRRQLQVEFPPFSNPADVMLDAIQPPRLTPEHCAEVWASMRYRNQDLIEDTGASRLHFRRQMPPFFQALLVYMDRSALQTLRAYMSLLISQALCLVATAILCIVLTYEHLDQFVMQSAFAALFLMLLQGVAAQRTFGSDMLMTFREARVGMPMVAYMAAKDLVAMFEVTLSAAVFTAVYGSMSGLQFELKELFAGSWAYVYTVFGLNYIFSIILSPGAAQMSAVVSSFISFCVSGVYQPQLWEMAKQLGGRGWMIPALSPIRWFWAFMLTMESAHFTQTTAYGARGMLYDKGYDISRGCDADGLPDTLSQAWMERRGWVCSVAPMLLLGIIFRFLAGLCLMLSVNAQTSGWARFFGKSEVGAWKLAGSLFTVLVGSFLALFLFAEVWIFGTLRLNVSFLTPLPSANGAPVAAAALPRATLFF